MNRNFILRHVMFVILFQFFLSGTNGQNQVNKPVQTNKPVTASLSKKLNVGVPGTLEKLLTTSEKKTLTSLTLTGTIDMRDFEVMNKQMPALTSIDLVGTKVAAYDQWYDNQLPGYAFEEKSKLKNIILPPDLIYIGSGCFWGCKSLKDLRLPPAVTKIGDVAFYESGIQTINMPEGLTSDFFLDLQYASQLKTIFTNKQFTTHMGVVYSRDMDTIYFCPRGMKADWSDLEIDLFEVKVIDGGAFQDCEKITGKLFLNSKLVTIGNRAFEHCTGITGEIEIPYSVRKIGNRAFAGCTNLEGVTIPKVKLFDDLTSDGCSYEFDAFDDQLYDKLKIGQRVDHGIPDKKTNPETIEIKTTKESVAAPPAYWDYTVKSLIYFEPFYQRSNWYEGDLDKCKKYYQNCSAGYYELSSKCDGSYCTINYNTGSGFIIDQDKDFSIEADIMFVFGRDNNSNKLVWGQDAKFNRFFYGFSGNGQFTIGKFQDDDYIAIKPWTVSSLIKKDGFNTLTVYKIGNQFYFYLNTELVYNCPFQPFYGQQLAFQGNENSTIRIKSIMIKYIEKK